MSPRAAFAANLADASCGAAAKPAREIAAGTETTAAIAASALVDICLFFVWPPNLQNSNRKKD